MEIHHWRVVIVLMLTMNLLGPVQAMQPSEHRFVVLPPDRTGAVWVLDTTKHSTRR